MTAVQRVKSYGLVHGLKERRGRAAGDRLDVVAAFCQCVCQVSDVLLLPAGHWGVELGHHPHSYGT